MVSRRFAHIRPLLIIAFIAISLLLWTPHWNVQHFNFNIQDLNDESSLDVNYEPSHLRRLCDNSTWTDGLWVNCHSKARVDHEGKHSVHGGLNNVRNRIQSCLRIAIDGGAGVVMPNIARRDSTNLKALGAGEPVSADIFWNMEHMKEELKRECPQLQVRFDLKGIETKVEPPVRHYRETRYTTGTFRAMVVDILKKKADLNIDDITPGKPVAIIFGDSFLAWDYEISQELSTIQQGLFKTLIYNQSLLDISSQILESPELKHGFVGMHLRAERDWPRSMGRPSDQMRLYIKELNKIERSSPDEHKTVYISSGNETFIEEFRKKMELLGYDVHDKMSILQADPVMLAKVETLMFDEKAIVEYQMLVNADLFLGVATSTMSSLIAYARAAAGNDTEPFFPKYVYPGSTVDHGEDGLGLRRNYPKVPIMKGDSRSKLMVVNGDDVMSYFP